MRHALDRALETFTQICDLDPEDAEARLADLDPLVRALVRDLLDADRRDDPRWKRQAIWHLREDAR